MTFGASLSGFLSETQKRELMEMEERWGFHDLFEAAEEKFKAAWHGQDADNKLMNANVLRASRTSGPASYYVSEYSDDVEFAEWDLCDVKVVSNLGGKGPDHGPPELRFEKVYTAIGVGPVDLVVKAVSNYVVHNVSANGIHDCFGIINVADAPSGTNEVDLVFGFVKSGTSDPVIFNKVYFTIYDMDTGKGKTGIEAVTVYDDATKIYKEDDCQFDSEGDLATGLTMTANTEGTGDDNPSFPANLTAEQRRKSITAYYKNDTTWKVNFAVSGGTSGRRGEGELRVGALGEGSRGPGGN